jgi:AraC-like DNA-binding protein
VAYREFRPADDLAAAVSCTWERTVPALDPPPASRVLPDGCVDLVWRHGELFVAGPDRGPVLSPLPPGTTIVGIRLRPGIAGVVLGARASELRDRRTGLDKVWGRDGVELGERIGLAAGPGDQRRLLEQVIRRRIANGARPDELVVAATRALGLPGSRVGELSVELAISERQLRRRFHDAVGYGPKTLDRVLRFQRFLAFAPALVDGSEQLARLAASLGYADQAHLSRDCLALSGLTPSALVASRANGSRTI